jgi:hypothetical protein
MTWAMLGLLVAGTAALIYVSNNVVAVMEKMPKGFFTKTVTNNTSSILLEIGRTHGDVLEVASPLKTMEVFRKTDTKTAAWGWVSLGTATSEIKVPATYRFHINLSELQHGRIENRVLIVLAPVIHPTLPVAFDTAGMEKNASGDWLRFDAAEQLAVLEKNITPALEIRAQEHVLNIREQARKDMEEFVQKWIVESNPDYRKDIVAVKVVFPGENPTSVKAELPLP